MSQERILWEQYLKASGATKDAHDALENAKAAERVAWDTLCACRSKIFSELGRKRLELMREFGEKYFNDDGSVK